MKVVSTKVYLKRASKILTESERLAAEDEIVDEPTRWPVVPRTGGIRKARVARDGRGKRGGARIAYYFWQSEDVIYFLTIYSKSRQSDLTPSEKKVLTKFVESLQ